MTLIVLAPALFTALFVALKGFRHTFVYCAMPILLLLPNYYTHKIPGIPIFTFHNYTLAITFAAAFLSHDRKLFKAHILDALVLSFVFLTTWSEYDIKGFAEGRNMLALRCMGTLAPYYLGKMAARHNGLLCGLLIAMVGLAAFVGFISPFEARLGRNPFDFLRDLWPTEVPWRYVLYRFGLRRVAGPFAHPICQGFFFSMMLTLAWWVIDQKLFKRRLWSLGLVGGLTLGLMAAGSRGPWMGSAVALALTAVLWRKNRKSAGMMLAVAAFVLPLVLWSAFADYASVGRGSAETESQETAAYRWEALEIYLEFVSERPLLGFGKDNIPVVNKLDSIDNQYLYLALIHGLPASILFLSTMLIPGIYLTRQALLRPLQDPLGRLGIAVAASLFGAILTQVTVFAGTQTEQVLFLLVGIAVALSQRLGQAPKIIPPSTMAPK